MSPVPPPIPSPSPPDPGPEGDSGVRHLTAREAKTILKAQAAAAKREERTKRIKRYIWGSVSLVFVTVLATAQAKDAIDGGSAKAIAPVARRVETLESDSRDVKGRLATVEHSATRTEAMVEMLVNNRGLKPPPRADGGP